MTDALIIYSHAPMVEASLWQAYAAIVVVALIGWGALECAKRRRRG